MITIVIVLFVAGAIWQSVMVSYEAQTYKAVGDYLSVDTYIAHYYSKGDGDITFVFIAGSGTPCAYTDFYNLQDYLAVYGLTVTFDHAGLGWSSETDSPRDIESLVRELSIIIDAAGKPDVVLVCHSLGSLEAIGYAQANPGKVKGIIFLDGGSPEYYRSQHELLLKAMNRAMAVARFFGINRLLGECGLKLPLYGENTRYKSLPAELQKIDKAMYYKYCGSNSTYKNIDIINENAESILSGNRLGDIPILVLSSDSGNEWAEVQTQLSEWSENCQLFTIKNAAHFLHWTNYDETVNYVDAFIQSYKLCE